jgi:hypothetical protein
MASRVAITSRRALGFLCALSLGVLLAAVVGGSASATTAPGYVLNLQVTLTDSKIAIVPHHGASTKYVSKDGRSAHFPRGIRINFVFTNQGTKTYVPAIKFTNLANVNPLAPQQTLAEANPVKPGRHVGLFGNFYFRGAFVIEKLLHKKVLGKPIAVTIY